MDASIDDAVGQSGAILVEATVDPFTPPMPPKVNAKQVLHFAESLVRGEPNAKRIALTAAHDRVRELI